MLLTSLLCYDYNEKKKKVLVGSVKASRGRFHCGQVSFIQRGNTGDGITSPSRLFCSLFTSSQPQNSFMMLRLHKEGCYQEGCYDYLYCDISPFLHFMPQKENLPSPFSVHSLQIRHLSRCSASQTDASELPRASVQKCFLHEGVLRVTSVKTEQSCRPPVTMSIHPGSSF